MATPAADHYFLINDDEAKSVLLQTDYEYVSVSDAITGEELELGAPIDLERFGGRWLRFLRK
jgi:hypothetical protein